MSEAETISKQSGSGVTFISADGEAKTLEQFVDEQESKEKGVEAQQEQAAETGFVRRRLIYRGANDRVKVRAGNPQKTKVFSREEINTNPMFNERNLKLMVDDSKTPLVQLVIAAMADGGWYSPSRIAERIQTANANAPGAIRVDTSNVSWRISQIRNSPVKPFTLKRLAGDGTRQNEYSFARCLIVNLKPTEIYQLYRKSDRTITAHTLAAKFPDIAAHLDRKGRGDKWTKDVVVDPLLEKTADRPIESLAENIIQQTIAKQAGIDVNIKGRVEIVFRFSLGREGE